MIPNPFSGRPRRASRRLGFLFTRRAASPVIGRLPMPLFYPYGAVLGAGALLGY